MMLKNLPSQLGEEYISGVLRYSLPTLGEPLLASVGISGYFTLVPDDLPERQVLNLKSGGILPSREPVQVGNSRIQEVPNSVHDAVSIIKRKSIDLIAPLFLAHEAQLNEFEMRARGACPAAIDGQLYWVFDGSWDSNSDLEEFIKKSMLSWHFLGILIDGSVKDCSKKIHDHQVEMMTVGAYDGESFLFWIPPSM